MSLSTAQATEKILKINDPAPFYGILSDEKTYRAYRADQKLSKTLEQENAMLSLKIDVQQSEIEDLRTEKRSVWGWFFAGAAAATLTVLVSK